MDQKHILQLWPLTDIDSIIHQNIPPLPPQMPLKMETGPELDMGHASERPKSFHCSSPENILVVGRGDGSANKRADPEDPLQRTHSERIK